MVMCFLSIQAETSLRASIPPWCHVFDIPPRVEVKQPVWVVWGEPTRKRWATLLYLARKTVGQSSANWHALGSTMKPAFSPQSLVKDFVGRTSHSQRP